MREESIKLKIAFAYFAEYDCTDILGNIDFAVALKDNGLLEKEYLLWAEAKNKPKDLTEMFAQLILTIGKQKQYAKNLPPKFIGAFDNKKMAFVRYYDIQGIFNRTNFNWNIASSNTASQEFKQIKQLLEDLDNKNIFYKFDYDGEFKEINKDISDFIKKNFVIGKKDVNTIPIEKSNFLSIYLRWCDKVLPTINAEWEELKKDSIMAGDFYLADLLSRENKTLIEKLKILLRGDYYTATIEVLNRTRPLFDNIYFKDNGKKHREFWSIYERPPKEEYWNYLIERHDLLVPQDIRVREGAFYTPAIWVQKAHEYLADYLGENWQNEYIVWDNCYGTGNLEAGLINSDNVWGSTINQSDINIVTELIEQNILNVDPSHIFQFDFLNDEFKSKKDGGKIPDELFRVISNAKKREKLVVLMNPPYAEVSSSTAKLGKGGKGGVNVSKIHDKYIDQLGTAGRELFTQFLIRVYNELKGCIIAEFSKMKVLNGSAFETFRNNFKPKLEKCFIAPANTFDNVSGSFPIGFKIWNSQKEQLFSKTKADVFNKNSDFICKKNFFNISKNKREYINKWISCFYSKDNNYIGFLSGTNGNDFQSHNIVYIVNHRSQTANPRGTEIVEKNLIECCIYLSVRKCIESTWLNHNDQFLEPNFYYEEKELKMDGNGIAKKIYNYESDEEFKNDCLAYTLFSDSNTIRNAQGGNHWIPFKESEVKANGIYQSRFMLEFLKKRVFSAEAEEVFKKAKELYKYYHKMDRGNNINASFYDIRMFFQGSTFSANGKNRMNSKITNAQYAMLLDELKTAREMLAKKIEQKVYDYGFLLR